MPAKLSVNVNAIAQLRNRRDLPWPSVTGLSRIALEAGAHGITVHPRPDQRHIRFTDVAELRALLEGDYPGREFNVEGYPTAHFLELVEANRPEQVTLVPDDPAQSTSDHGWDFAAHGEMLAPIVTRLRRGGARVSLFIDADPAVIDGAAATGCDCVELYTGPYGALHDDAAAQAQELERLGATADAAIARGLHVNAGHDLTLDNLPALAARVPELAEVSIGHAITADALVHGLAGAVRRYLAACAWTKSAIASTTPSASGSEGSW